MIGNISAGAISSKYLKINVTGGVLTSDTNYFYRTFTSSGTLSVDNGNLECDILVIAGGGGGGGYSQDAGGGGQLRGSAAGAGGLLVFTGQSLSPNSYTVIVGAGGASTTGLGGGVARNGNPGNDSQFGSLAVVKGGGRGVGGFPSVQTSRNGGSGGAGLAGSAGGTATSGQGSDGGAGDGSFSGGGGGKGAAGQAAVFLSYQGAGGDGVSTYSSWGQATSTGQNISGTYWYAGGGSNATPGKGGGSTANTNATANTGGGGGGDNNLTGGFSSGAGGSGVVIVRYLKSAV